MSGQETLMLIYLENMIKQNQYIELYEVLSRILRHPLLQDVNIEQAVQYTVDFIHIFGLPDMFLDKEVIIPISRFKGQLPCDLISINQVMDTCSHTCLRSMTDTFYPDNYERGKHTSGYIGFKDELTFKVQNHIIYTSFEEGEIKVNYKAIPVDDNGFPLVLDNAVYLKALELYIKKEVFIIKFDQGEVSDRVLQHTEQQYAWAAGQLQSEFSIPSEAEMASICHMWTELIQTTTHRDNGYKNLGDRQYLRKH